MLRSGQPEDHRGSDLRQEIQRAEAVYYAMVTFLDSQVGAVLSALRDAGLEETTRVVYLDDHGDPAVSHRMAERLQSVIRNRARVLCFCRDSDIMKQ